MSVIDHTKVEKLVKYLESLNRFNDSPGDFPTDDLEKLEEMGYEYIVLHERGCRENHPDRGARFFDLISNNLSKVLGPPQIYREEWIELPPETWKARKMTGRVAVFKVPEGKED